MFAKMLLQFGTFLSVKYVKWLTTFGKTMNGSVV